MSAKGIPTLWGSPACHLPGVQLPPSPPLPPPPLGPGLPPGGWRGNCRWAEPGVGNLRFRLPAFPRGLFWAPRTPTDQALHQCVPWTWVSCRAPTLTPGWQAPRFLLSCDGLVQRATPDLLLSTRPHLFPGLRCPCSAQARDGLSRSFVRPASPEGRGLQDGFM